MATIIKSNDEGNESPTFIEIKDYFLWIKQVLLFLIAIEFGVLLFVIGAAGSTRMFRLGLASSMVIALLIRYHDQQINQIHGLITYPAYATKHLDEKAKIRADEGEALFVSLAEEKLAEDYLLMVNVYLPDQDNLQKVDSVIIGPSGSLYLVEVKNWYGVINGQITDRYWLTETGLCLSPYQENKKHIDTVAHLLQDVIKDQRMIHNLVVNMEPTSFFNVCKMDKVCYHIFDDVNALFQWIIEYDRSLPEVRAETRIRLADLLMEIHFQALTEAEVQINRELLVRYNLLDEASLDVELQIG